MAWQNIAVLRQVIRTLVGLVYLFEDKSLTLFEKGASVNLPPLIQQEHNGKQS